MLQQQQPADYVIATGHSYSLQQFVETAFAQFGLDWARHTRQAPHLLRPTDIAISAADPSRARTELGWSASSDMPEVVARMCRESLV